jgi:hypothetical protein
VIRAIETKYAGCRFRSRLEARWAVFFDTLGVEWQYEPEGFDLPSGRYLPDFYLPALETYIEIKPVDFTKAESDKCHDLSVATRKFVLELSGDIPRHDTFGVGGDFWIPEPGCEPDDINWDTPYLFCICEQCGVVDLQFEGRSDRMPCRRGDGFCKKSSPNGDKDYSGNGPRISKALTAARSARFEH